MKKNKTLFLQAFQKYIVQIYSSHLTGKNFILGNFGHRLMKSSQMFILSTFYKSGQFFVNYFLLHTIIRVNFKLYYTNSFLF